MQQGTVPTKQSLWQALKDLDFLSSFFSWFFMLLTRLSEPLMLLSTLYVVAETGVPVIALPALHNLAIGIMITAPEVILPGSFVVAARAQKHARLLFAICWTFVVLTLITLISLFVWHLTGGALAWLMCARCAAAVGYSILMRVMSHGHDRVQIVSVPDVLAQLAELSSQVQRITTTLQSQPTQPDMSLVLAQVIEQLDTRYTQHMETMIERTVEQVKVSIVESHEQQYSGRARLSIVNGHSMEVNTLSEIQVLPVNTTLDTSDTDIGLQIRASLQEDSTLSGRALAGRVGCSPTTANKWKSRIEAELQAQ